MHMHTHWLGRWRASVVAAALWLCLPAQAAPWVDEQGRFTPLAAEAALHLGTAADEGLHPEDYAAQQWADKVKTGHAAQEQDETQFHQAVERFLRDLHDGRILPASIREKYDGQGAIQTPLDVDALVQKAAESGRFASARAEATPASADYVALREQLARYRAMQDKPHWQQALVLPKGATLASATEKWPHARAQLVSRLVDMGDMAAPEANAETPPEQDTLAAALRSFQQRMGLPVTGQLNKATLERLNTPVQTYVQRIALAMERQRWTPTMQGQRTIVVNIPEFTLRAYALENGKVVEKLSMRTIVGKAGNHRTPLFDEDMLYVEFSPYWNVPPSIARKELMPKVRNDPSYLARNGYEVVGAGGVEGVDAGTARIRQKPGRGNALGDIKFAFPNRDNIYLHHTPSTGAFARARRDLSHGCVRVQEPFELAKFVFANDPAWTDERIKKAMRSGKSQTARLQEPLPVLITYSTTVVRDGKLFFLPDVYRQDAQLASALQRRKK